MVARFLFFCLVLALFGYILVRLFAPLLYGKAKLGKGKYNKYVRDEEFIADKKVEILSTDRRRIKKELEEFWNANPELKKPKNRKKKKKRGKLK